MQEDAIKIFTTANEWDSKTFVAFYLIKGIN